MTAVFRPTTRGSTDFCVLDPGIRSALHEKLDHFLVTVERGVVQRCTGVIESSRDGVNLGSALQERIRRFDMSVHTRIHECVVNNILVIVRP